MSVACSVEKVSLNLRSGKSVVILSSQATLPRSTR